MENLGRGRSTQQLLPSAWCGAGAGDGGALKVLLAVPVGRGRDRDDDVFLRLTRVIALEVVATLSRY